MARVNIKGAIIPNQDAWIYDWFEMPYATANQINNAIDEARKNNEILDVYINSPGGDIASGAEMYAALQEYGKVKFHVVQACSAASVVMCAGPSEITPVGMVMIHNVSTAVAGDNRDMSHASEVLKTADKSVAAAYVAKTGKPINEILGYMAKETWLTAEEAVEMGLCDEVSKPANDNTTAIPQMVAVAETLIPQKMVDTMRNKRMVAIGQMEILKLKQERI